MPLVLSCAPAEREASGIEGVTVAGVLLRQCDETSDDTDNDGLADVCELGLAQTFAPLLIVAPEGCNWDDSVVPARAGGEYYFGVQPASRSGTVRIAYLPAYYSDCGWRGTKCRLPFVDCAPHAGDSETILVDVRRGPGGRWLTEAVFLSAHCFGRSDSDCRWYAGDELAAFDWVDGTIRGRPVVWVAEGRQANYPSRSACDRGHTYIDTCDRNRLGYRFPVVTAAQNIGSRARPVGRGGGCVGPYAAGWSSARVDRSAIECFWSPDSAFRGWQRNTREAGATPYARYLDEVAGF